MSESLADKMLESHRTRKAFQLNADNIKIYISEGLSENSKKILKKSALVLAKKPRERTEAEKNLIRLRDLVLCKIHRIFKRMEEDIYGKPFPKATITGNNPMYFLFYIFYLLTLKYVTLQKLKQLMQPSSRLHHLEMMMAMMMVIMMAMMAMMMAMMMVMMMTSTSRKKKGIAKPSLSHGEAVIPSAKVIPSPKVIQ